MTDEPLFWDEPYDPDNPYLRICPDCLSPIDLCDCADDYDDGYDDEPRSGMSIMPGNIVEQWEDDRFIYGSHTWWDGTQWQHTEEILHDKSEESE